MDRAEATGFGVAAAGHLVLLAVLTLGFANAVKPPIVSTPMEVSFVDEVALESTAPAPSQEEPATKAGEVEGAVEPTPPPPAPEPVPEPLPQPKAIEPVPQPKPAPTPKPAPKPVPKAIAPTPKPSPKPVERPKPTPPASKAAPRQPAPANAKAVAQKPAASPAKAPAAKASTAKAPTRPTGRLGGLLDGISEKESTSRSTSPPAKVASAAVQSSLGAEVRRQLKPHWKSPTGADADQLRTKLSITLAPSGAVTNVEVLGTTGQTESNRPQVKLHQEQAVKAARLASPFRLPAEYYDAWKVIEPSFDKRLSQ